MLAPSKWRSQWRISGFAVCELTFCMVYIKNSMDVLTETSLCDHGYIIQYAVASLIKRINARLQQHIEGTPIVKVGCWQTWRLTSCNRSMNNFGDWTTSGESRATWLWTYIPLRESSLTGGKQAYCLHGFAWGCDDQSAINTRLREQSELCHNLCF